MERTRTFMLSLVVTLLAVAVLFVLPFLDYFLLAVILAYVLHPLQRRLRTRIGGMLAATVIVLGSAVVIIVPLIVAAQTAIVEGRRILSAIQDGDLGLADAEASIQEWTGFEVDLAGRIQDVVGDLGIGAFGDVISIVGTLAHVMIGLGLTLFLLYYFLKDGDVFVAWLRDVLPLSEEVLDELFGRIDDITAAVLAGHVFVAIIQAVVAGLGLVATGIPNATFWTVVMIVLALLPIIGSFLIWGPAVVWLFLVGRPVAAAALLIYGTIVVGITDDYLRPIVVDRYAKLSPALIIIGVLGGVYAIGFMGLFVGPIILGALKVVLDVYDRAIVEGEAA